MKNMSQCWISQLYYFGKQERGTGPFLFALRLHYGLKYKCVDFISLVV